MVDVYSVYLLFMEHLGLHENMVRFHNDVVNFVQVRRAGEISLRGGEISLRPRDFSLRCGEFLLRRGEISLRRREFSLPADGLKFFTTSSGTDGHLSNLTT